MHCCGIGFAAVTIGDNNKSKSINPVVTFDTYPKIGGLSIICMPNAIPYSKIMPIRSPKRVIFSGGLLLFYLVIPSQAIFSAPLALATPIPLSAQILTKDNFLSAKPPISQRTMLPQAIADKIFQDLAQRTNQPTSAFTI